MASRRLLNRTRALWHASRPKAFLPPMPPWPAPVGSYRLTLVGGRSSGRLREASGALVLSPSTFGPDAFSPSSNPLSGGTDIDLRMVGAFAIGDPG